MQLKLKENIGEQSLRRKYAHGAKWRLLKLCIDKSTWAFYTVLLHKPIDVDWLAKQNELRSIERCISVGRNDDYMVS